MSSAINVCGKCQAQYLPKQTGVVVIETAGDPPKAFRLWNADVLGCPICGAELVTNFGHEPIMESHEAGFDVMLAGISQERRRILYNPEYLATTIRYETKIVRSYAKTK